MKLLTGSARAAQVRSFPPQVLTSDSYSQLLFSIVVLGLSISLAKGQGFGKVPPETGYAAFTGGLGIVAGLLGIISLFVENLDGVITWLVDGVASVALLAGGIVRFPFTNICSSTYTPQIYAVGLKHTNCNNWLTLAANKLLSGGCYNDNDGDKMCWWAGNKSELHDRCVSAQADTAFMLLGFIACLGALIASFMTGRR